MRLLTRALSISFINPDAAHLLSTCKRELTFTNGLTRCSVPWRKAARSSPSKARSHLLRPSLEKRYSILSPGQEKPAPEPCQLINFTEREAMLAGVGEHRPVGALPQTRGE